MSASGSVGRRFPAVDGPQCGASSSRKGATSPPSGGSAACTGISSGSSRGSLPPCAAPLSRGRRFSPARSGSAYLAGIRTRFRRCIPAAPASSAAVPALARGLTNSPHGSNSAARGASSSTHATSSAAPDRVLRPVRLPRHHVPSPRRALPGLIRQPPLGPLPCQTLLLFSGPSKRDREGFRSVAVRVGSAPALCRGLSLRAVCLMLSGVWIRSMQGRAGAPGPSLTGAERRITRLAEGAGFDRLG